MTTARSPWVDRALSRKLPASDGTGRIRFDEAENVRAYRQWLADTEAKLRESAIRRAKGGQS